MYCEVCGKYSNQYKLCYSCYLKTNKTFENSKIKNQLVNKFIDYYCAKNNTTFVNIINKDTTKNVLKCREILICLLSKEFKLNSVELGKLFNRDHTSILHVLNKNKTFKYEVELEKYMEFITKIKTEILSEENQLNKTYEQKYPSVYKCKDGHYVKSKSEREIDNYLFENNIIHIYEKDYIAVNGEKFKCDFYIPAKNLYIEYFGFSKVDYVQSAINKIKLYQLDKNINFIYLSKDDDYDLIEVLKNKMNSI